MAASGFVTSVDEWVRQSQSRLVSIFKESTQRSVTLAQSRIPVDTGFARASIRASTQAMPQTETGASRPKTGKNSVPYDPISVTLVIAGAKMGESIYVGWTANYVEELERGHSQQAPSGFIRLTALEWPRIVAEVTAEAKSRSA